jgi:rubrerythrin
MNVQECFQTAARVEILLRDLYAGLAGCFRTDARLRESFLGLADEEEQHALRIRLLALHRKGVTWTDEAVDRIGRDLVAIVAELSAMAKEMGTGPDGQCPEPVLRRVIEVERRCGSLHAEALAQSTDPVVRGFFSSLARQDAHHERLLEQALQG